MPGADPPLHQRLATAARDWGTALTGAAVLLAVGSTLWLGADAVAGRASSPVRAAAMSNVALALEAIAALLAVRAARLATVDARARRGWGRLAAALGVYTVADAGWVYSGQPSLSWCDAGYIAFYPIALWALLTLRRAPHDAPPAPAGSPVGTVTPPASWLARSQLWLDVTTVVVSAAMVVWYWVLGPIALSSHADGLTTLVMAAYPAGDLVLLFGCAAVLLDRRGGAERRPLLLVAVGSLLMLVGDLSYSYLDLQRLPWSNGVADAGWILGALCLAAGAQAQWWGARAGAAERAARPGPRSWVGMLPYVAAVAAYAPILVAIDPSLGWRVEGPIVGAVVLTAVVCLRQYAALRENARLLAERAAREAHFAALVQHSSDAIVTVDASLAVHYASPAVARVLGLAPRHVVGRSLTSMLDPEQVAGAHAFVAAALARPAAASDRAATVWRLALDASGWRSVEVLATALPDESARGDRLVVLNTRDVTERVALEEQLVHRAAHDPLTGLANRAAFRERVAAATARPDERCAVLFLDLDDFKAVNDTLGHAAGDRLLAEVAERLLNATRGCDVVARLGGDEFAILLPRVVSDEHVVVVAERVLGALRAPIRLPAVESTQPARADVTVGASVGIAHARTGGDIEDVLRDADLAMYAAKRLGKGRHATFEPWMRTALVDRVSLEADLREGIDRGELRLVYQPIVDVRTGALVGAEALVRWEHPERGTIEPAQFIPLAEESGLIVPLGRWVLDEACARTAAWHRALAAAPAAPDAPGRFYVSVNVSARQLDAPELTHHVAAALAASGLAPECLVLEVTESTVARDVGGAIARLGRLREAGVRLALDDFGTGQSSLGALLELPLDILKLDRAFTRDIGGRGRPVARAVLALGAALGLRCVAEGIETAVQHGALRELGCDWGQGWHYARPMPPERFAELLGTPLEAVLPAA